MILQTVFGLQVTWYSALTYAILAVVAAYEAIKILTRQEPLEAALAEATKEILVTAVVAAMVLYYSANLVNLGNVNPQGVVDSLQSVAQEAYMRNVKIAQCIANIRLSGPVSAYAGYAEAKFSIYDSLYEQAIWMYNQLAGLARFLAMYGGLALTLGLTIYAAAARRIGGIVIGVVLGLWIGLAVLASAASHAIDYCAVQGLGSWGETFYPFSAVGTHCDDELLATLNATSTTANTKTTTTPVTSTTTTTRIVVYPHGLPPPPPKTTTSTTTSSQSVSCNDYTGWQMAIAYAWLFLFIAPSLGLAVGYLLGQ